MPVRRNLYRETYKRGAVKLKSGCLPVLQHEDDAGKKYTAIGCELMAAGVVDIDGIRLEYQDLRVYVDVK